MAPETPDTWVPNNRRFEGDVYRSMPLRRCHVRSRTAGNLSVLPFRAEIHIDDKPDYHAFANETKKMTGAEFAARFAVG